MSAMMNHDVDVGHNKKEDNFVSANNKLLHPFSNVHGEAKMYEMFIGLNYYSICEGPISHPRLAYPSQTFMEALQAYLSARRTLGTRGERKVIRS